MRSNHCDRTWLGYTYVTMMTTKHWPYTVNEIDGRALLCVFQMIVGQTERT